MQPIVMAILLLLGWGVFAVSAYKRWNLMMVGASEKRGRFGDAGARIAATLRYAFWQERMPRYPWAGWAHRVIFFGFLVLLLRSLILWGRGFDADFNMWIFGIDQPLGKIYSFLKDFFAVLVILGTLVFFYYRLVKRLSRMTLSGEATLILVIIFVMMWSDVFYDGAEIVERARHADPALIASGETEERPASVVAFAWYEPAGSVAAMMLAGAGEGALITVKHLGFWTHAALVLIFLNILPYSKHFHVITAIPNVYTQDLSPPGRLPNLEDIDGMLERGETLGVKRINQFSWKAILDWYTCTECGRCSDQCPATTTGKKLSPKHFTLDLRDFLYENETELKAAKSRMNGSGQAGEGEEGAVEEEGEAPECYKDLVDGVIDPEVLWACTTCRACEVECPVFISYVDKIVDMRRYLVQERGEFPNELQGAFRGLESVGNPFGFPAEERAAWAEGLDVPRMSENPDADVLYWVGCMPSFEDRARKVAVAFAKLMKQAGVNFAILGEEETCTGDAARRAGNEYLFQMFAAQNVEVLNGYGIDKKTIVCTCPHCFNTLANEYPDFGGNYKVVHHTDFLADLVRQGKIKLSKRVDKKIAFHDSCYLGRYNEIYNGPRSALKSIPGLRIAEPVETRDRGMCCGAGGAQMFKEEEEGGARVNHMRVDQLMATGAEAVANACPFCTRMITDGLADKEKENVETLDVAELLLMATEEGDGAE